MRSGVPAPPAPMTGDSGLAAWLSLCLTPGLGASTVRQLLRAFGPPESVLSADPAEVAKIAGDCALPLHSGAVQAQVMRALEWSSQPGCHIVTLADARYPRLLLEIPDPPPLFYARGNIELLSRPALAVVGSRNATAQGLRNAETFSRTFSVGGLTIVSGLALGIDEAAHRGGLGSGSLITARLAAEQGREVFAIPGSIHSPLSRGCHSLIKQGAKLVEAAEDVLVEFGSWSHASTSTPQVAHPGTGLLGHMGFDPVDIDALCTRASLPAEAVASELLRLELDGLVATLPGGRFQRLS